MSRPLLTRGMAPRVVLITGCSSGIGLSTAVMLANDKESRFIVYATMRNLDKKDKLEETGKQSLGETLIIKEMDVCSEESVNAIVEELLATHQRIDVVINNAGVAMVGPLETQSMDMARYVFETNFFRLLRVTKAVLPSMKNNREGHIINISSMAGIIAMPFGGIYSASKFAIEGLTESLAPTLRKFNIRCSLIEPGPVSTQIMENSRRHDTRDAPLCAVDEETKQLFENITKKIQTAFATVAQSPDEVGHVIMEALLAEKPHLRYQTNKNDADRVASKLVDPTGDKSVDLSYQRFFQ